MKGFGILYKKMRRYFQKIFFKNCRANFRKILLLIMKKEKAFFVQIRIFSKIRSKIFENIISFSCRGCQALSSDMRITILLLTMREKQEFFCKYLIFRKFDLKFLNNILKISLHFLVENVNPFHLICELLFYC